MKILVADDDPVYRSLLQGLLTDWGFEPTLVGDGLKAWEALRKDEGLCIAILDWMMPKLNGYDVCKMVREARGSDDVYILMITGSRTKADIMRVMLVGGNDYLIKPFEPVDLKIHLRNATRFLEMNRELRELRAERPQLSPATT